MPACDAAKATELNASEFAANERPLAGATT
jgi:hypothetical protein